MKNKEKRLIDFSTWVVVRTFFFVRTIKYKQEHKHITREFYGFQWKLDCFDLFKYFLLRSELRKFFLLCRSHLRCVWFFFENCWCVWGTMYDNRGVVDLAFELDNDYGWISYLCWPLCGLIIESLRKRNYRKVYRFFLMTFVNVWRIFDNKEQK